MFSIGVYVTSGYKNYPEFKEYMDGAIRKYIQVGKPTALITGDYKSTKSGNGLVARYAFENNIPFRRFATLWQKHNPTKPDKKNNAGAASNAKIIENSNGCIMFWTPTSIAKWNFMSGGCYLFKKLCSKNNLNRLLIPIKVDIYKSFSEEKPFADDIMNPDVDSADSMRIGKNVNFRGADSEEPASLNTPFAGLSSSDIGVQSSPTQSASTTVTTTGDNNTQDAIKSQNNDVVGNIDTSSNNSSSTAGNIVSQIPVDTDNDGTVDTSINAIDTDNDGAIDSKLTPVDVDGNGTIDKIEITPIPNTQQSVQNQSQVGQNQQQIQQPQVAQQSIPQNDVVGNIDDDDLKNKPL